MARIKQHLSAAAMAIAAMTATAYPQSSITATIPVKVNVDAFVSIEPVVIIPMEGVSGESKTVQANTQTDFTLQLGNTTSITHGGQRLGNAPVSISRGRGSVSLNLSSESYGNARVSLFSIDGKRIMHGNISGNAALRVSRENLAKGIYLLSVKGENGNSFSARTIHNGGPLHINVAFGGGNLNLAKQTADDYGQWEVTVTPEDDTYKDTTYVFTPVADPGTNPLHDIVLGRKQASCVPDNRNPPNVTYATRGNNNLVMRIKLPSGAGPWPVIMYIHGGIWMGTNGQPGDAGTLNGTNRANPYALAEITYTYANSNPPSYPAAVEDVLAAVRYLRANAAQYCIDPDRIIAAGHSSGGYFANMAGALSAVDDHTFTNTSLGNANVSSKVQASVSACGLTDLSKLYEQDGNNQHCSFNQNFMGFNICQPTADQVETLRKSNPLTYITAASCGSLPPIYLLHGTNDRTVPVGQADIFKDRIDDQCSNHNVEYARTGRGHDGPTADEAEAIFDWLDDIFYP